MASNADDFYCRDGSVTTMHNELRNLRRQAITNCLPKSSLVNKHILFASREFFIHSSGLFFILRTQFRTPKLSTNCQVGKYFHSQVDKAVLILSLFVRRIFGRLEGFRRNRNLNGRKKICLKCECEHPIRCITLSVSDFVVLLVSSILLCCADKPLHSIFAETAKNIFFVGHRRWFGNYFREFDIKSSGQWPCGALSLSMRSSSCTFQFPEEKKTNETKHIVPETIWFAFEWMSWAWNRQIKYNWTHPTNE